MMIFPECKPISFRLDEISFGTKKMEFDLEFFCDQLFKSSVVSINDSTSDFSAAKAIKGAIIHQYYINGRKTPNLSSVTDIIYNLNNNSYLNDLYCFPHITEEEFLTDNPLEAALGEYIDVGYLIDISENIENFFSKHHIKRNHNCKNLSDVVASIKAIQKVEPVDFKKDPFCFLLNHPSVRHTAALLLGMKDENRRLVLKRAVEVLNHINI